MIVMPVMPAAQEKVWHALFAVQRSIPTGWTVVGGQMVHLHCAERDVAPHRTTTDGDTVMDIRADRNMLRRFTDELHALGFESVGPSAEGHEHRWQSGQAQIDVLIPTNLGERSQRVLGATGSTTVATAGGQQALSRTETVAVRVANTEGAVPRPNLVGALIIKGAATSSPSGDNERHKADFALLATLIRPSDSFARLGHRDRQHLRHGIEAARGSAAAHTVAGWEAALTRLERAMNPAAVGSRTGAAVWARGKATPASTPGSFTEATREDPGALPLG